MSDTMNECMPMVLMPSGLSGICSTEQLIDNRHYYAVKKLHYCCNDSLDYAIMHGGSAKIRSPSDADHSHQQYSLWACTQAGVAQLLDDRAIDFSAIALESDKRKTMAEALSSTE